MKPYIHKFLLIAMTTALLPSCEKALDINTNPLQATSADPNVILPFVITQYSNRHTTELGTRMMDVPQHFTACFNSPKTGSTGTFLTGNTWSMMYTQVLGNLLLVEQDAETAGPSSNNVAAIAKVLKANTYFELTMIWEAVPFSEALDAVEFSQPKFDSQETILNGVIDILDEAISLINAVPETGVFDVSVGDIIYDGDMDSWLRYANSLKLRVLMVLNNKMDMTSAISSVLSQPLIETNAQAAVIRYSNAPGGENAYNRLVEAFFGVSNEVQGVYAPSAILFNALDGDPRLGMLVANPDNADPLEIGQFAFAAGGPTISDNVIRNDLPHMLMMPAEVDLYRAELAMASGDAAAADEWYRDGVRKACEWWGGDIPGAGAKLDATTIEEFVNGLAAPTMEDIHMQLYIESFIRPIVAWNTVRRTGVPNLSAAPGSSISTILKRFTYPPDEVSSNTNTPANEPTDKPMWFEN